MGGRASLAALLVLALVSGVIGRPRDLARPNYKFYHTRESLYLRIEELSRDCPALVAEETRRVVGEGGYAAELKLLRLRPGWASGARGGAGGAAPGAVDAIATGEEGDGPGAGGGAGTSRARRLRVLLNFGEHGREFISSEIGVAFLELLCDPKGDGLDRLAQVPGAPGAARAARLLETVDFLISPLENANGRDLVERGRWCERRNGRGVDPNRNWGVDWGLRETDYDEREENPGSGPFSEPEPRALRDAALAFSPDVWVNVHSGMCGLFSPWDHQAHAPRDGDGGGGYRWGVEGSDSSAAGAGARAAEADVGARAAGTGADVQTAKTGTRRRRQARALAGEARGDGDAVLSVTATGGSESGALARALSSHISGRLRRAEASNRTLAALRSVNKAVFGGRCAVGPGGRTVGYLAHGTATDYMHAALGVPVALTWEVYGDTRAPYDDCFKAFNPTTQAGHGHVVRSWTAALVRLLDALATHPLLGDGCEADRARARAGELGTAAADLGERSGRISVERRQMQEGDGASGSAVADPSAVASTAAVGADSAEDAETDAPLDGGDLAVIAEQRAGEGLEGPVTADPSSLAAPLLPQRPRRWSGSSACRALRRESSARANAAKAGVRSTAATGSAGGSAALGRPAARPAQGATPAATSAAAASSGYVMPPTTHVPPLLTPPADSGVTSRPPAPPAPAVLPLQGELKARSVALDDAQTLPASAALGRAARQPPSQPPLLAIPAVLGLGLVGLYAWRRSQARRRRARL